MPERERAANLRANSGLVFTTVLGTPMEPRNVNRHFAGVLKAAGSISPAVPRSQARVRVATASSGPRLEGCSGGARSLEHHGYREPVQPRAHASEAESRRGHGHRLRLPEPAVVDIDAVKTSTSVIEVIVKAQPTPYVGNEGPATITRAGSTPGDAASR